MAFEGLTEKLSAAFKKLRGKGRLSEADVKESMREIRLALLEADVSYKVVKDFIKKVTERAVGADVLESLTPAQMIVKIVNEELTALMGSDNQKIRMASQPPTIVMMVGLQGAGKTTHTASWRACSRSRAKIRCSSRAISTALRPSSSSRSSARRSAFRSLRWGRPTPSMWRRRPLRTLCATETIWCSSIRRAVCMWTRR